MASLIMTAAIIGWTIGACALAAWITAKLCGAIADRDAGE